MQINDIKDDALFGVIGVCGVNGNLIARILMDHGYKVQATDMVNKENCRFGRTARDNKKSDVPAYRRTYRAYYASESDRQSLQRERHVFSYDIYA